MPFGRKRSQKDSGEKRIRISSSRDIEKHGKDLKEGGRFFVDRIRVERLEQAHLISLAKFLRNCRLQEVSVRNCCKDRRTLQNLVLAIKQNCEEKDQQPISLDIRENPLNDMTINEICTLIEAGKITSLEMPRNMEEDHTLSVLLSISSTEHELVTLDIEGAILNDNAVQCLERILQRVFIKKHLNLKGCKSPEGQLISQSNLEHLKKAQKDLSTPRVDWFKGSCDALQLVESDIRFFQRLLKFVPKGPRELANAILSRNQKSSPKRKETSASEPISEEEEGRVTKEDHCRRQPEALGNRHQMGFKSGTYQPLEHIPTPGNQETAVDPVCSARFPPVTSNQTSFSTPNQSQRYMNLPILTTRPAQMPHSFGPQPQGILQLPLRTCNPFLSHTVTPMQYPALSHPPSHHLASQMNPQSQHFASQPFAPQSFPSSTNQNLRGAYNSTAQSAPFQHGQWTGMMGNEPTDRNQGTFLFANKANVNITDSSIGVAANTNAGHGGTGDVQHLHKQFGAMNVGGYSDLGPTWNNVIQSHSHGNQIPQPQAMSSGVPQVQSNHVPGKIKQTRRPHRPQNHLG